MATRSFFKSVGKKLGLVRTETQTTTPKPSAVIESKGGAIVGDTPSGYVSEGVPFSPGKTTIVYSGGGGGSSCKTGDITQF